MTLILTNGIRKNGATRICFPQAPRLTETLPRLTEPARAPLPCPAFNRPRICTASLEQALRLWAGCPSDTEAHQLACRVILGVQSGAIEVVESA